MSGLCPVDEQHDPGEHERERRATPTGTATVSQRGWLSRRSSRHGRIRHVGLIGAQGQPYSGETAIIGAWRRSISQGGWPSRAGDEPADLVIRGGRVLCVFTREWLDADVAIVDGVVAGLGDYEGRETIDAAGRYLVPGFVDPHLHIESSKLLIDEFARLVLPLGTTAVVADPHEIANVLGTDGVHWLCDAAAEPAARRLLHGLVVRARLERSSRRAARSRPATSRACCAARTCSGWPR